MARVLLIDDDPAMRVLVTRILKSHEVHYAPSSAEGLAMLSGSTFAAVICDLTLPSMDGMALHSTVAETSTDHAGRFIFVTGATDVPEFLDYTQRHQLSWLAKPFAPNAMRTLVDTVLTAQEAQS